jgi:hypothetical protein
MRFIDDKVSEKKELPVAHLYDFVGGVRILSASSCRDKQGKADFKPLQGNDDPGKDGTTKNKKQIGYIQKSKVEQFPTKSSICKQQRKTKGKVCGEGKDYSDTGGNGTKGILSGDSEKSIKRFCQSSGADTGSSLNGDFGAGTAGSICHCKRHGTVCRSFDTGGVNQSDYRRGWHIDDCLCYQ